MFDSDNAIVRFVYLLVAAVGGSIVSLSQLKWQLMTRGERGMTIFVGVVFSIFGVPWLVSDIAGVDIGPIRVACGVTFFGAVGAPWFIPPLITFFKKKIGLEEPGK